MDFDSAAEPALTTGETGETMRTFFSLNFAMLIRVHFSSCRSTIPFNYIKLPDTPSSIAATMKPFADAGSFPLIYTLDYKSGFPGAISSIDVTHLLWEMCPHTWLSSYSG